MEDLAFNAPQVLHCWYIGYVFDWRKASSGAKCGWTAAKMKELVQRHGTGETWEDTGKVSMASQYWAKVSSSDFQVEAGVLVCRNFTLWMNPSCNRFGPAKIDDTVIEVS